MPNPLETSFIPQQPILKAEGSPVRRDPINIPLVVTLLAFFVSGIVAGGLYYWKLQVVKQVEAKKVALQEAESQFSIEQVKSFERLQYALSTAKKLVDSHTIFSVIFDLIENRTAKNIGLTDLSYSNDAQKGFMVALEGQAPSYAALYFQVSEWRKTPTITKVDVMDFTLDELSGVVDFTIALTVDPSSVQSSTVLTQRLKAETDALSATSAFVPATDPLSGLSANSEPR